MKGGHTPGPWECQATDREGPDFGVSIVGSNLGGLVGYALPWPTELDSGDYTRVEANARLIAAAPGLLGSLQAIFAELDKGRDAPGHCHDKAGVWDADNGPELAGKPCDWCTQWEAASLAIAKATGLPLKSQGDS